MDRLEGHWKASASWIFVMFCAPPSNPTASSSKPAAQLLLPTGRESLLTAQRMLTLAYYNLWEMHMINAGDTLYYFNDLERQFCFQSATDPLGAVFFALLLLRRDSTICQTTPDGVLTYACRRRLAALLYTAHKLAVSSTGPPNKFCVYRVVEQFLLPEERPVWAIDYYAICNEHVALETEAVIGQPLFLMQCESPMSYFEDELGTLLARKQISQVGAAIVRAGVFFLFGAAMSHPRHDIMDLLNINTKARNIGLGALSVLLTCLCMVSTPSVAYRAPYESEVNHAAAVLLSNARCSHAEWLRKKGTPYALPNSDSDNVVRMLLSPNTLERAWELFSPWETSNPNYNL